MSTDRNHDEWPPAERLTRAFESEAKRATVRPEVRDVLESQLWEVDSALTGREDGSSRSRIMLVAALAFVLAGLVSLGLVVSRDRGSGDLATTASPAAAGPTPDATCFAGESGLGQFALPVSGVEVGRVSTGRVNPENRTAFLSLAVGRPWRDMREQQELGEASPGFETTVSYLGLPESLDPESIRSAVEEGVRLGCSPADYLIVTPEGDTTVVHAVLCDPNFVGRPSISGLVVVGDLAPPACVPGLPTMVLLPVGSALTAEWVAAFGCSPLGSDEEVEEPIGCDERLVIGNATTVDPWDSLYDGRSAAEFVMTIALPR